MRPAETVDQQRCPVRFFASIRQIVMQNNPVAVWQRHQMLLAPRSPFQTRKIAAQHRLGMSATNQGMWNERREQSNARNRKDQGIGRKQPAWRDTLTLRNFVR